MTDYNIFELGNLRLQGGATLRGAWIAYKTYGTLNAAKDNVIVFPTFFGGQHYANEAIIGPGAGFGPGEVFHHRAEHDGERAFVFAVEYADAL